MVSLLTHNALTHNMMAFGADEAAIPRLLSPFCLRNQLLVPNGLAVVELSHLFGKRRAHAVPFGPAFFPSYAHWFASFRATSVLVALAGDGLKQLEEATSALRPFLDWLPPYTRVLVVVEAGAGAADVAATGELVGAALKMKEMKIVLTADLREAKKDEKVKKALKWLAK